MSLYREWVDFVTYPLDTERVHSREERLNTRNAIDLSKNPDADGVDKYGAVVTLSAILALQDDEFEAMEIDDYGHVIIWTKKRVWCLWQDRGMEKLLFLPRHFDEYLEK